MNKPTTHFTVYDTEFNLSEPKDCDQLVDMIETFGAMHTWSMYDLLCTVDQIDGCEASYKEWLKNIAQKFGNKVIDTVREICLDDCAVKTILSQYIRNIDQYFKSNGGTAFMPDQFTLPAYGSANEDRYIPVERVEVLDYPDHLVTRVIEPQRDAKTGLTRIGNVDNFSIMVYTVNIAGKITQQFGLQHPDEDAAVTDSVQEIAQNLFNDYLKRQEAE